MLSLNQLSKLRANGRKNSQHCFQTFDRFQTLHNNSQQHGTTCNRVCKRMKHVTSNNVELVCEQALRGALAAWWEKEGEFATTSLEFEFPTSNAPVAPCRLSCQISANQREAETSANVNKY